MNYMKAILASLVTILIAFPVLAEVPQALLIEHVNVIPMTGERLLKDVSVLVRDGRIAAIGPSENLKSEDGVRVIEGEGGYLLPGLVEMHVHLRKRISLDLFLGHGVTTVRNMDGTPTVLEWRDAISSGSMDGPSLTTGSPFLHRHAKDSPERYIGSVEDARRLVRHYAAAGYDTIKIAEVDDAPFFALMEEARAVPIPVVGHIPNYELSLDRVFAERMASVEHVEELFRVYFAYEADGSKIPAFVEMVRRSGVPISTLIATEVVKNGLFEGREAYLTPERLAWIEKYNGADGVAGIRRTLASIESGDWKRHWVDIDFLLRLVRALHEAGVTIVPGTDSGGSLLISGTGLHEELALLSKAGLSPYDVIESATVAAARVLGAIDRKGTVAVGKDADLVLVTNNPLDDLSSLREPRGLVVRGKWYGADALAELRSREFSDETSNPVR